MVGCRGTANLIVESLDLIDRVQVKIVGQIKQIFITFALENMASFFLSGLPTIF